MIKQILLFKTSQAEQKSDCKRLKQPHSQPIYFWVINWWQVDCTDLVYDQVSTIVRDDWTNCEKNIKHLKNQKDNGFIAPVVSENMEINEFGEKI